MSRPEPEYVDVGEEFNQPKKDWRTPRDLTHPGLLMAAFEACGRGDKYKTPKEATAWGKIDLKISKGLIPEDWVRHLIENWVKPKNEDRVRIKFEFLIVAINNQERMLDWQGRISKDDTDIVDSMRTHGGPRKRN